MFRTFKRMSTIFLIIVLLMVPMTSGNIFLVNRNIQPDLFCQKRVIGNFVKFKGKHLCQCLFQNKVASPDDCNFIKKRLCHRYFLVNFAKSLKNIFFYRTSSASESSYVKTTLHGERFLSKMHF